MLTAPVLEEKLAVVEQDGIRTIMLDLRDLTFIDSSGLRVFIRAWDHSKANGHRLVLLGASSEAHRLFQMTGTEFLITEQEAASALDRFTHDGRSGQRATAEAEASADE